MVTITLCTRQQKRHCLMDSVGEGEGGKIWENGVETCIISCMERLLRLRCFRFSPPGHVC